MAAKESGKFANEIIPVSVPQRRGDPLMFDTDEGPRKDTSLEVLAKLRELSATALEMTRRALDLGKGRSIDKALKPIEDIYLHELMKTSDAAEGINAFMEKRQPVWRNR